MRNAATAAQMLVRLCALVVIVLGVLFWTGNAPLTLLPVHILAGLVLVLCLWTLAAIALRAGVPAGLAFLAFAWGLVVVALGLTQTNLLVGSVHWLIQVLHLAVGVSAIGIAEGLGVRIRSAPAAAM